MTTPKSGSGPQRAADANARRRGSPSRPPRSSWEVPGADRGGRAPASKPSSTERRGQEAATGTAGHGSGEHRRGGG
eukprot:693273-Heterocapsa_arctica.AAC.1